MQTEEEYNNKDYYDLNETDIIDDNAESKNIQDYFMNVRTRRLDDLQGYHLHIYSKKENKAVNAGFLNNDNFISVLTILLNLIRKEYGDEPNDYIEMIKILHVIRFYEPPTGCGPIRLDRFSPCFNNWEKFQASKKNYI